MVRVLIWPPEAPPLNSPTHKRWDGHLCGPHGVGHYGTAAIGDLHGVINAH
jgi:hypothetical protein